MREEVTVEGGVGFEKGVQVKRALGRHQLIEANLLRGNSHPMFLLVAMVGVRPRLAHAFEDHAVSLTGQQASRRVRPHGSGLCQALPMEQAQIDGIRQGYAFEQRSLQLGVLNTPDGPVVDVPIRIPIQMFNRHGLVAGATGTGKTVTLQVMAEQLSNAGVPVFAADIKGDLSGMATPGAGSEKLLARVKAQGQGWVASASPVEFLALGGQGVGVPVRAAVSSFGPVLLSKVLDLNDVQESSLGLVFYYADQAGLPLLDMADLRSVLQYLVSDEGKPELKNIGGLSAATVGVILRALIGLEQQGADVFFGEPEFESSDLLRVMPDGRGVVTLLELPNLQDRPALFSTFLMWLLADLFHDLPEVGDLERPKLVFFFDEAHLLFKDASKAFLDQIAQTVRLIRSKGVGVFFVTQTPKDVPEEVLAQLGSRVQHQLRAHTPNDAKALKATVSTYPTSGYDLGEVLQTLGIGEAVVTVMNPKGAPTPVAWTRLFAPQSQMGPTPADVLRPGVAVSSLMGKYGAQIDRDSAHEILARKLQAGADAAAAERAAAERAQQQRAQKPTQPKQPTTRAPKPEPSVVDSVVKSSAFRQFMRSAGREIVRGLFGTARRR